MYSDGSCTRTNADHVASSSGVYRRATPEDLMQHSFFYSYSLCLHVYDPYSDKIILCVYCDRIGKTCVSSNKVQTLLSVPNLSGICVLLST